LECEGEERLRDVGEKARKIGVTGREAPSVRTLFFRVLGLLFSFALAPVRPPGAKKSFPVGARDSRSVVLTPCHGSRRTGRTEERSQTLAGPVRTEVEVEVRDGAAGHGRALPNPSRRRGLGNGGGWGGGGGWGQGHGGGGGGGAGRGRRRRCRCCGAGGAGGEIGQPDGVHSPIHRPTLSARRRSL